MKPYFEADGVTLYHGDALAVLRELPDGSVDAVVTDPPAGISFMGRAWDHHRGGREQWSGWLAEVMAECLRVAKPGAHAVVWALPRTSHRTACGLEDAGWEIRDRITHLFASGFPKSLAVDKAIDKIRDWTLVERLAGEIRRARAASRLSLAEIGQAMQAATDGQYGKWYHRGGHMFFETGRSLPSRPEWDRLRCVLPIADEFTGVYDEAEREVLGEVVTNRDGGSWADGVRSGMFQVGERKIITTAPATDDARRWSGWGTALKPAAEDWWLCRKPFPGSVASNVLAYGTGALNVDAARVGTDTARGDRYNGRPPGGDGGSEVLHGLAHAVPWTVPPGRWPTNLVLSHAATPDGEDLCVDGCVQGCPVAELDRQSGVSRDGVAVQRNRPGGTYQAPSAYGVFGNGPRPDLGYGGEGGASRFFPVFRFQAKAPTSERPKVDGKGHETVKPLDLMRWLVRLVTPPGGLVLDPFAGSGTTGEACIIEGFRCLLVEREAEHLPKIVARLSKPIQPVLEVPCA